MKIVISCSCSPDFLQKYKKCIESQKKYCKKYNFDYNLDSTPVYTNDRKEWTWKKHYILNQFEDTHEVLILIDADCEIKESAPSINTVLNKNSIYYVNGISGRPNAGFMIFRNDDIGKYFRTELINRRSKKVPLNFKVKEGGDNGHVIWVLSEMSEGVQELPICWNCSQPKFARDAYIIHYTNSMRPFYTN